jgi:hypothetical protein
LTDARPGVGTVDEMERTPATGNRAGFNRALAEQAVRLLHEQAAIDPWARSNAS